MLPRLAVAAFALPLFALAAELPVLKIEATDGGSVLTVRNTSDLPLTAFFIELVDYPGSYYNYFHDDVTKPIAPGAQLRIPIVNMTIGAAPEYVKMQAAIFADGSSAGITAKTNTLLERRLFAIKTKAELAERMAKTTDKASLAAELKAWSDSLPPAGKVNRASQAAINQAAARAVIAEALATLKN